MSIHVFGIRHHGPGCARTLAHALDVLTPDAVLVEGPPDANGVLPLAADAAMRPPVALLVYPVDAPRRAVFYPFAPFSPEWQAIQYALKRSIPVRFMDLPLSVRLARLKAPPTDPDAAAGDESTAEGEAADQRALEDGDTTSTAAPAEQRIFAAPDALALLAQAAGYEDYERWWDEQVERRFDGPELFEAITEAMEALRNETGVAEEDALREASMRQAIRAATKEGFARIAVVCGAWHAPVLRDPGPAKADAALLKGLDTVKVDATWIPWTYSRLSYRSGYGAGVQSPGWYHHLWVSHDRAPIRWLVDTARLLREKDLPAPSSSVIEAVRLADALASLRDLQAPGLPELREASLAVFCRGDFAPLALIRSRLEIGTVLGGVPESALVVPLQRDLRARQKSLRLRATDEIKDLDLDLRKDNDRERSLLFYRLRLLDVPWATPQAAMGKTGTFHELWQIRWQPEFEVNLVEASVYGHTVEDAASARARHLADAATDVATIADLLDRVILASLPEAVDHCVARLQAAAAVASDVRTLMGALPPLAQVMRYGDVRQTPTGHLAPVIDGIFERIVVGLPSAGAGLADDAAADMESLINRVQQAIDTLDRAGQRDEWAAVLRQLVDRADVHALLRGRAARLLFEQRRIDDQELERCASLSLSHAVPPAEAAAWLEGLLRGTGQLLLYQDGLWMALDRWLVDLPDEGFREMLPLIRRAFSEFQPSEREAMGKRIRTLRSAERTRPAQPATSDRIDVGRANLVLPVLAQILGVRSHG